MQPNNAQLQLDPTPLDQLRQFVARAQTGDAAALAQVREYLQQTGLWQTLGDLTRIVEEELLKLACGSDPLSMESIKQKMQDLKAELTEVAPPTAMGRLLAEQVVIDWLRLRVAELEAMSTGKEATARNRRRHVAHEEYLGSLRLFNLLASKVKQAALPRKRSGESSTGDWPEGVHLQCMSREEALRTAC